MKRKAIYIVVLSLLLLSSCTVIQTIDLETSSSGRSSSIIDVEDFFVDVLYDYSEFLPATDESIMDSSMDIFASELRDANETKEVELKKTGENSYILDFDFTSIEGLIKTLGKTEQSLIKADSNSFRFFLDINNYPELAKVVPFLADPNFEVYGATYNQDLSKDEYLEMIGIVLGDEGPDAIENGSVSISITVPGTITDVVNAKKINNKTACYTFPIIDFLLLHEPLTFTINWK